MIKIPSNLLKNLISRNFSLSMANKQSFAKEAKPTGGKDGKKGGKE